MGTDESPPICCILPAIADLFLERDRGRYHGRNGFSVPHHARIAASLRINVAKARMRRLLAEYHAIYNPRAPA